MKFLCTMNRIFEMLHVCPIYYLYVYVSWCEIILFLPNISLVAAVLLRLYTLIRCTMPFRCCVPNCKSGSGKKQDWNVHLFHIPSNEWPAFESAIPRLHFKIDELNESSRIFSSYSTPDTVARSSCDTNPHRMKKYKRKLPRLIPG